MRKALERLLALAAGLCALAAVAILLGLVAVIAQRGAPALSWSFLTEQIRLVGAAGGIFWNLVGTIILLASGDVRNKGMLALCSFLGYAIALGVFAVSTHFALSLILLGVMGLANSLQAVMRQTSFHLLTPDQVRGRAFAVFNMFSQGANAFGGAEVGFMAALLSAPGSLLFGCAIGALLTVGCWVSIPGLRRFGIEKSR